MLVEETESRDDVSHEADRVYDVVAVFASTSSFVSTSSPAGDDGDVIVSIRFLVRGMGKDDVEGGGRRWMNVLARDGERRR